MATTPKSAYIPLIISLLFILFLGWCSWYLHTGSHKFQLFKAAFLEIVDEKPNSLATAHRLKLIHTLEQQLACASSADINFVQRFKGADNYPQNALKYTFKTLLKMQVQIIDITLSDSVMVSHLIIGGGDNIIKVNMHFAKVGDKLMLSDLENICPIFIKVRCFEESQKRTSGPR